MSFLWKILCLLMLTVSISDASDAVSKRIPQLSNAQVNVWKTTLYPHAELAMHRHDYNRVLVALDDGILKITNDQGKSQFLNLEKNQSYYFTKNTRGELHVDQNISDHPVSVIVIELKE